MYVYDGGYVLERKVIAKDVAGHRRIVVNREKTWVAQSLRTIKKS